MTDENRKIEIRNNAFGLLFRMRLVTALLASSLAFAEIPVAQPPQSFAEKEKRELKSGAILYQRFETDLLSKSEAPASGAKAMKKVLHLVTLKLDPKLVSFGISPEENKGQTPTELDRKENALVSINASFFDEKNRALGLTVSNGKKWKYTQDTGVYAFLACTIELNCQIEPSEGAPRNLKFEKDSVKFFQTVSGRPRLVENGIARTATQDKSCPQFCSTKHPRVGIGLSKNKETLLLALVEGRQAEIEGCSLSEFAKIFVDLGAFEALNLDGGGSATLLLEGKRVSGRPSNEPSERPVANIISIK